MVALDLNDPDIVNSPYYNLQQNDILYVESGKAAMRSAKMGNITPWVSVLSVLVSLASLINKSVSKIVGNDEIIN